MKKIISLFAALSIFIYSCDKQEEIEDEENNTTSGLTFTDHWFFDFNGTIDGGEGFDIIKSSADDKVYICGAFLHANENWDMKNLARWVPQTNTWEQVPGIDYYHSNFIRCVDEDDEGNLYFGGDFSTIGGATASRVAKFSPSDGTWSSLRDMNFYEFDEQYGPISGGTYGIAVIDNYVYIGGGTYNSDSAALKYIRRFNLSNSTWESVGEGTNGRIRCMTTDENGNLYVGGEFTEAGGVSANYVAKWDGSTWSALGGGADDYVLTVEYANGNLYTGGSFKNLDGNFSWGIGYWDGSAWNAMDMGIAASWGDTPTVQDIAVDSDGKVYIGGFFDKNYRTDGTLNHCAVWDNGEWSQLGVGLATSSSQGVIGMMADGKDVYFTGYFTRGEGNPNDKVNTAIWNETK
jgi:hypothetical protein